MDTIQIIENIRNHYLDAYRETIRLFKVTKPNLVPELLLELPENEQDEIYRLYRIDMVSGESNKPELTEFNQDSYLKFTPIEFRLESMDVSLYPLYWNGVEFQVEGKCTDWYFLDHWVRRWHDLTDSKPSDNDGLSGVIHSITRPEVISEIWSTSIDFGSAPSDAFWEFLRTISKLGFKKVRVGSFSMIDINSSAA